MTPSPPVLELSPGGIIAAALSADVQRYSEARLLEARCISARYLAHRVGSLLSVPEGEVWDALTFVPDNLLHLLDSPQGWSALSSMVAHDLGILAPAYAPSIN